MKISANVLCPCHSNQKYKNCCQPYHKGILPSNALKLMRSRYSAYALGLTDYIIKTTHPNHDDHQRDSYQWHKDIVAFCENTSFSGLKILEFVDGENEAYVDFVAVLGENLLREKSRFLKIGHQWFYESGEFPE